MHRIDGGTAVEVLPVAAPDGPKVGGFFRNCGVDGGGNPISGTIPDQDFFNGLQETIAHAIETAGLALEKGNYSLLTQAIQALSASGAYDIPVNAGFGADYTAEDLSIAVVSTMVLSRNIVVTGIVAKLDTAPTGSGVVFDIKADGVSVFDALPSFAADTGNFDPGTVKPALTLVAGAILSFEVTAVGVTTPGKGLRLGLKGRTNAL
ncbi:hypothetical protein [Kiloniella laminariae]|uniref:hypothetical protein n=1 Tax=Kiloniella laminariae TaxID=454162 RepID=UPI0003787D9B|nr:hypothetical protein [Kiloniella laminariae]